MGILIQIVRVALSIVAGFIAGWLLFFVVGLRFLPPGLLVPGCMVAVWFLLPRLFPVFKPQPKTENAGPITLHANGHSFEATHHAKNVAINAATGQVWFRDTKGKEWLLNREDVRRWKHEWVDQPNGYGKIWHNDNYLILTTADVDHPTHKIKMGSHFQHELAKEWHARLTAMLNP
ncbi:MAG: hypothetical protein RSP_09990 [Rhodanobacter sp.]